MAVIPDAVRKAFDAFSLNGENRQTAALEQHAAYMRAMQEKAFAKAREDAPNAQTTPNGTSIITLAQYHEAAKTLLTEANQHLAPGQPPYELHQFFNFSNMNLTGVAIRGADIEAIKSELFSSTANPDRPDDDSRAFTAMERGLQFNNTRFHDVTFIPATAFNELEISDSHNISISGGEFIGMNEGDTLKLERGNYEQIHFENIRGGTLELTEGAQVKGVTGTGASMHVVMGPRSMLAGFTTLGQTEPGAPSGSLNVLDIKAQPGAVIADATFYGTTLAPNSTLNGATFDNVAFNQTNLAGVDFSGARFTRVTLNGEPATRDSLNAAGVREDHLPQMVNEEHPAAITPPTPQQMALAAARNLASAGTRVDSGSGDVVKPPNVPQTEQAAAAIEARNDEFANSAAALAAYKTRTAS